MPDLPTRAATELPWLTVSQMVEADRLAIEDFGISLLQMMEHAGSGLARLADELAPPGPVTVLAGAGNNGGDGLCAARHLINRGRDVEIVLASQRLGDAASRHLQTLGEMGVAPIAAPTGRPVVIDALVGYGLDGPLRGRAAELAADAADRFVASLDIPSGFGAAGAIEPSMTLTLALPKRRIRDLRPLYLADLGLPERLWARMGIITDRLFRDGSLIEVE